MKRIKWDSKTKAKIVLEGLSGMSVSEVTLNIKSVRISIIFGGISFYQNHTEPLKESVMSTKKIV